MILEDVAKRADLFVEAAAAPDAERLGHRDLHAGDVSRVPDRFEERVGEAEVQQVLHRLLPQEVVDAIDRVLGKRFVQRGVEGLRGREVAAERFLDDQPRPRGRSGSREIRRHGGEQAGRNGEVEHRARRRARAPRAADRRWPGPRSRRRRRRYARPAARTRRRRRRRARPGSPSCARTTDRSSSSAWRRRSPGRSGGRGGPSPGARGRSAGRRDRRWRRTAPGRRRERQTWCPRGREPALRTGRTLDVAAELIAHRREQPVGEVVFPS